MEGQGGNEMEGRGAGAYFCGGGKGGKEEKGKEMGKKWKGEREQKESPWCPQPLTPSAAYAFNRMQVLPYFISCQYQ